MQDCRERDLVDFLAAHAAAEIRLGKEREGNVVDAAHMAAGFLAAEFNGGGQRFHHPLRKADNLLRLHEQAGLLTLHYAAEPPPRLEQLDDGLHPPQHHKRRHRLADDVHDAELVGLFGHLAVGIRRDEEDRRLRGEAVLVQAAQHFDAVHLRHDDVQQHGAETAGLLPDHLQAGAAVGRLRNLVVRGKNPLQDGAVDRIVVDDEQRARRGGVEGKFRHKGPLSQAGGEAVPRGYSSA